ncbi:MAG: SMI1/KNR4 family protein [Planctomycetia bacterium]|nr:SMI1/KNR4 family protein [Planctomycetia bacterium]
MRYNVTLDDVFRELRDRNEPVPLPMRLPTASEVDDVERRLAVKFPSDFRRYLLEASDVVCGPLEPVTITCPDSHTDLFSVIDDAWESYGVPRSLLPICENNADFYCINPANEVVFWSHNGWSSEKWPSLAHWIRDVWLDSN